MRAQAARAPLDARLDHRDRLLLQREVRIAPRDTQLTEEEV
ncbi:MAG TPA: hypothetical protein VKB34_00585 [Povalibacter sp.]|nr:hypothetical protein [Povalibacter sp.]